MCTAITFKTKDFYFGRTLDYDFSYGEKVTITPRNYPLPFYHMRSMDSHYAMIGMAHVAQGYPLYYDAINEKGLGIAGLNFVGNAVYKEKVSDKDNVATFELIPWILSQCSTVKEAKELLKNINITNTPFHENLPVAQLHWMFADFEEAVTVEATKEGIKIYDNPVGVLTNNPPFDKQLFYLNNYMHLSIREPKNLFSSQLPLHTYSRGMGALGLPGDLSSPSRFVRAAFTKMNSVSGSSELESVNQFFHILGSVEQQKGCCIVEKENKGEQTTSNKSSHEDTIKEEYEITIYTSCCNGKKGIYYYTTYENHQITALDMHKENLNGSLLSTYPLILREQIYTQNK